MTNNRLFGRKGTQNPGNGIYREVFELVSEHDGRYLLAHITGGEPQVMHIYTMQELAEEFELIR